MLYPEYHTPPPYGHPLYLRGGVFRPVLLRATPILPLSKGEYPEGGREYVGESGSMLRGGVFREFFLRKCLALKNVGFDSTFFQGGSRKNKYTLSTIN